MPTYPKIPAPGGSHLKDFRLFVPGEFESGDCWIEVSFRAKGRVPEATYRYTISDESRARELLRDLSAAIHPGAAPLKALEKYPYRKIS